jgi:Zn finger protein HypA/HybF involved in hydrogenase expression
LDTLFKDYEVQNSHHENLSKCIECRLPVTEPSGHFLSFEIEKNSPNQECQTCKMFLPSKCSLSAHQRIHKRMPRYVCPECGEGKNYPVHNIKKMKPRIHQCKMFKVLQNVF